MKDDWLTIPDFDNYEINRKLQVRHKKTKQLLKQYVKGKFRFVYLHRTPPYKPTTRAVKILLRQALVFNRSNQRVSWHPVPSLGGKYEFNAHGTLRNARTKRRLQKHNGNSYMPYVDGVRVCVCVARLQWEVFGAILHTNARGIKKPVILRKGSTILHFDSHQDAARYIAKSEYYSVSRIMALLAQRRAYIKGWDINYLEDDCMGIVEKYTKNISCCPKEDSET